jgi:hypothetical protein
LPLVAAATGDAATADVGAGKEDAGVAGSVDGALGVGGREIAALIVGAALGALVRPAVDAAEAGGSATLAAAGAGALVAAPARWASVPGALRQ